VSKTTRQKQIDRALATRRRQVEDVLEHERFDLRVQRGEWPTHKVGQLFGIDVFTVDATVPALALMGMKHGSAVYYDSKVLGPPLATAQDLMVACQLEWVDCAMQFFVSTAGWRKLRRSLKESQDRHVNAPANPNPTDYVGVDLGRDVR
jgi:hypothetical protein